MRQWDYRQTPSGASCGFWTATRVRAATRQTASRSRRFTAEWAARTANTSPDVGPRVRRSQVESVRGTAPSSSRKSRRATPSALRSSRWFRCTIFTKRLRELQEWSRPPLKPLMRCRGDCSGYCRGRPHRPFARQAAAFHMMGGEGAGRAMAVWSHRPEVGSARDRHPDGTRPAGGSVAEGDRGPARRGRLKTLPLDQQGGFVEPIRRRRQLPVVRPGPAAAAPEDRSLRSA